jgi:C-terminal processing protease CtpA/Prc
MPCSKPAECGGTRICEARTFLRLPPLKFLNVVMAGDTMTQIRIVRFLLPALGLAICGAIPAFSQQISSVDKERAHVMLNDIAADVKKHYYDPKFHGVDWDAKVRETRDKIDQSPNLNMAMSHLAAALDSLNDSHTFFMPPPRPFHIDFGYMLEMIGDKCFVIRVRPKSDADAKGLKPGDEVLKLNGYAPDLTTLRKMEYVYRYLRPQAQMKFDVVSPDGKQHQVVVTPHVDQFKIHADFTSGSGGDIWDYVRQLQNMDRLSETSFLEFNDDLMIVKMPEFNASDSGISGIMDKARKHKALIIDLREDPG